MRTSYLFDVEFITKSWMAADALCLHPINSLAAQSSLLGVGPRAPCDAVLFYFVLLLFVCFFPPALNGASEVAAFVLSS